MKPNTIRYQILAITFIFGSIFYVLGPLIYINRIQLQEQKNAVDQISWIFEMCSKGMSGSPKESPLTWGAMVNSIHSFNLRADLSRAILYSADGTPINSFPNSPLNQIIVFPEIKSLEIKDQNIEAIGPVGIKGHSQSYLYLDFSLSEMNAKFREMSWIIIIAGTVLTLVITGILFLSINRLFIGPLYQFKSDFESACKTSEKIAGYLSKSVIELEKYHSLQMRAFNSLGESSKSLESTLDDSKKAFLEVGSVCQSQDALTKEFTKVIEGVGDFNHQFNSSLVHLFSHLKTLEEIHRKNNLLTLNAFIEGNRAGVAGHGLQVIATNLREISTKAETVLGNIFESWSYFEKSQVDMTQSRLSFQKFLVNLNSHQGQLLRHYLKVEKLMQETTNRFNELKGTLAESFASVHKVEDFQMQATALPEHISSINQDLKNLLQKLGTDHDSNLKK